MTDQNIEVNLDGVALLSPLMAGHVLNAYYSALLLKKSEGTELTKEERDKTMKEVLSLWSILQESIGKETSRKTVTLETSRDQ